MAYQTQPLATCKGVEIFASGTFRGKSYGVADLEEIARNFSELGPSGKALIHPPVVLGHEETQEFLEKTDLPAAAWPSRVWLKKYHDKTSGKQEAILYADLVGVPPVIAKLINSRAYRKVSPEIYDDFEDDFGNHYGMALRRIALLGGEIPQVKRLADIPLARFSERRTAAHNLLTLLGNRVEHPPVLLRLIGATHNTKRGTFSVFAEVGTMDRAALIQKLLAAMPTLAQTVIDTMTDEQLSAMVAALPAPVAPVVEPPMMMADLPREDMIADLVAAGQDPAVLEAKTDEELKALYDEMIGTATTYAEMTRDEMIAQLTAEGKDPQTLAALSDEELKAMIEPSAAPMAEIGAKRVPPQQPRQQPRPNPKKVTLQYAEQTFAEAAKLRREIAVERLKLAKQRRENKRNAAEAFCERLVLAGQIRPVDVPAYTAVLVACDDQKPAVKFSDNGKTEFLSAFEAKKRTLAKLPVVLHFGEKIKSGIGSDESAETNKVRRFAESDILRPALAASGKKPASYVDTFVAARKKNPELTAAAFGVPAEYCS